MADGVYLDLFTRGLLWATDKLDEDGKPKPGYGPVTPPRRNELSVVMELGPTRSVGTSDN